MPIIKLKEDFYQIFIRKRIWVKELNRFVTVKLSSKALKTLAKNGTSELAKLVQTKKIKVS